MGRACSVCGSDALALSTYCLARDRSGADLIIGRPTTAELAALKRTCPKPAPEQDAATLTRKQRRAARQARIDAVLVEAPGRS